MKHLSFNVGFTYELNSNAVLLEMSSARSVKQQTSDFILILIVSSVPMFVFWLVDPYLRMYLSPVQPGFVPCHQLPVFTLGVLFIL